MNILVTVGSSPFESLIRAVDSAAQSLNEYNFTFQISDGAYKPRHGRYFPFTKEFTNYIDEADIIITHAGAGTVFELLEKQKKCIIVPNYERIDKHQSDLTTYVEKKQLALTCHKLDEISAYISKVNTFTAKKYIKEDFFFTEELIYLFNQ